MSISHWLKAYRLRLNKRCLAEAKARQAEHLRIERVTGYVYPTETVQVAERIAHLESVIANLEGKP